MDQLLSIARVRDLVGGDPVILPDGSGTESTRPRTGRTSLFVVAALVVVAGLAVMGVLSPAGPAAVEATTTSTTTAEVEPPIDPDNFTIGQIARGTPLDWTETMMLGDGYPIALFDHQGWIYLFAIERPNFSGFEEGGLRAWRSADGESWEALGQVIPARHRITRVSPTGQGIVALEQLASGREFGVWRSEFGFDWTVEEVAVDGLSPGETMTPQAVGGSESTLVVAGNSYVDVHQRIQEELRSMGAADALTFGWGVDHIGGDVTFPIYGPLGLELTVLTPDDLDLGPAEVDAVINEQTREPTAMAWAKTVEAGWQQTVIPDASFVESVLTAPDGELMALGYGPTGFTTWSSRDGVNWDRDGEFHGPSAIDDWRGRLVGPSDTGRASVVVSGEDGVWEDIGPRDLLPSQFSWHIGPIGAGPGGIASLITSWDHFGLEPEEPPEPARLTSEGTTLALDFASGTFALEIGDGTTHRWRMYESAIEVISIDLETAAVEFHDPETGILLASYPIEDINEAEAMFWSGHREPSAFRAFVFTADGAEWTIQDATAIGEHLEVMHIEVTETQVIAAGVDPSSLYHPTLSPGFALWSARIP